MIYSDLVGVYGNLESNSKRLAKTYYISELLKKVSQKEIGEIVLLLKGRVFPQWSQKKIGVASQLVLRAINVASGMTTQEIEKEWKKTGDLGKVAENLISKKKQVTLFSEELTIQKVFSNIVKLSELEGQGSVDQKVKLIAELLSSSKPKEARYIVRTVLEELRVGVADGTLRDAIVWAFLIPKLNFDKENFKLDLNEEERKEYNDLVAVVQGAYDITNDFSEVANLLKEKGIKSLERIKLVPGKPVKVMLYQKAKNMEDAFERVGTPCALEYKYDGFRMCCHKKDDKVMLFTRRFEDVSEQFPDVVEFVKNNVKADSFIIDCEAVGYDIKSGRYLPFQKISQRIKRKYGIHEMAKQFPVELNIFDIMYYDGKSVLGNKFSERRAILEKIIKVEKKKIVVSEIIITNDLREADAFYKSALKAGNEGVMAKNLDAIYKPGSRVGYGVKVKPVMESLDLVIVGAQWGEGKRSGWLTSFTLACYDDGEYLEIGKVGTGIKEKEEEGLSFVELTEMLKPLIIEEKGKDVKIDPAIVIEIDYEEIQKSTNYNSGFALRFPRLVRLRDDKSPDDASDINYVEALFKNQRHGV